MPELPEVETVRSGLSEILEGKPIIEKVKLLRPDLRWPIPKKLPSAVAGQPVTGVRRRAKYLLIDTPKGSLLSHLGMTGSWRLDDRDPDPKAHDHCVIILQDGRQLVFRDPRRFGMLDFIASGQEAIHPRLKDLGPEPLDDILFNAEILYRASRKRRIAAKVFVMDQKVVVGVGNIYASEALFRAGIKPQKLASRLSFDECDRLVHSIKSVLRAAIEAGGSSIRDYRDASGESGSFQDAHLVYDRGGEPCRVCGTKIRSKVMGGRSTYWCPNCQK